jgi:hypothetical protein
MLEGCYPLTNVLTAKFRCYAFFLPCKAVKQAREVTRVKEVRAREGFGIWDSG